MTPTPPSALLRLSPALISVAWLALATPAQAIVSRTDPGQWTVNSLADPDSLDAEAKLVINGSTGCSGSLLAGGAFVLTAAHCVTATSGALTASQISLSFDGGRVSAEVSSASQISVFGGWSGTAGNSNDLALLRLDRAVTGISGFQLYSGNPAGQAVLLAGYGYTGVGETGALAGSFGTLHWGQNVYDAVYKSSAGAYLYDFDNGLEAQNVLGVTGLGTAEAMIAPGDSGGGSFVVLAGQLYLAGVHSFGASTVADIDRVAGNAFGTTNSSYGEIGGDSVLYSTATQTWLAAVTSVPEPAAAALWLVGALVVGAGARRRRGG